MANDVATLFPTDPDKPPLQVKPVRDWIWLKERPKRDKEHLIQIPDTAHSPRLAKWEVVAVGPGVHTHGVLVPPCVKPGDNVVVQPAFAMETTIEGIKHALIQDAGIVAKVEGDAYGAAGKIVSAEGFME